MGQRAHHKRHTSTKTAGPNRTRKRKTEDKVKKDAIARNAMVKIAADCGSVLAFIKVVAMKPTRVMSAPLLMQADKRAQNWFCKWAAQCLTYHPATQKKAPQNHSSITGVLSEVATI